MEKYFAVGVSFCTGFFVGGVCTYFYTSGFFKKLIYVTPSPDNTEKDNINKKIILLAELESSLIKQRKNDEKNKTKKLFLGSGGKYLKIDDLSLAPSEELNNIKNNILDQFKIIEGMDIQEGASYTTNFGYRIRYPGRCLKIPVFTIKGHIDVDIDTLSKKIIRIVSLDFNF